MKNIYETIELDIDIALAQQLWLRAEDTQRHLISRLFFYNIHISTLQMRPMLRMFELRNHVIRQSMHDCWHTALRIRAN